MAAKRSSLQYQPVCSTPASEALVFNGLSDKGSGLANAEYFITDAAGVERKKPAEINTVEGSVTVQVADASSNATAPENRSEYKVGSTFMTKRETGSN